jgi:hypothetical protein
MENVVAERVAVSSTDWLGLRLPIGQLSPLNRPDDASDHE